VQFIHESARQFFLDQGLQKLDIPFGNDVVAIGHKYLATFCQAYIEVIIRAGVSSKLIRPASSPPYPFLEYARLAAMYHAELAAVGGLRDAICEDSASVAWYKEPGSEDRNWFPSTWLQLLASRNYEHLVDIELERIEAARHANAWTARAEQYINAPSKPFGCTALHRAIYKGNFSIALALLKHGANVNVRCKCHDGTIRMAIEASATCSLIESLLIKGAHVKLEEALHGTLLCKVRDPKIAEILLRYGANPSARCIQHCRKVIHCAKAAKGTSTNLGPQCDCVLAENADNDLETDKPTPDVADLLLGHMFHFAYR
jgi:hypothetical protein